MTEDDIITLVDGRDEADDDDDDNEEAARKDVTIGEARHHIGQLIDFFEQSTPNISSADVDVNRDFLDALWKMSATLTKRAAKETVQRKLTDFFKL